MKAQKTTGRGAGDQAEAEGRADQTESFGPVLRDGTVGDVRLGRSQRGARAAGQQNGQDQDPKRTREPEQEISHRGPEEAEQQHGTTPHAV